MRQAIRFLTFHQEAVIGLLISLLIAVLIGGLAMLGTGVFVPAEPTTGEIVGFGRSVGKYADPIVSVRVDGALAQARAGPRNCRVGDVIDLERRRTPFGWQYEVAPRPDPCRRKVASPP